MIMNKARTRAIGAAIGIVVLAVLAGCSGGGSSAPSSSPKSLRGQTVTLMNWEAEEGSPYSDVLKQFTKDTGIKVDYQFAASGDDYWPKTRAVLGSNNPPDLMRIDDDFVAYYASTGKLQDLQPYLKANGIKQSDYYPTVFNNTKEPDGKIVGWSLGIQPRVIYYNKTAFEKAGLPLPPTTWSDKGWTWADFLKDAQALTTPDHSTYGADIIDDSGYEMIFPVNNGGTGRWSKNGKDFTLADKADAAGVQYVADLTCKYDVQPPWSDLQQSGRGQEMFAAGQVGMIERVSTLGAFFQQNVKGFDWDIAPMPGEKRQKTYGNQIVFSIPKAAKHRDAAWALLQYLTTEKGASVFAKQASFVPGYKAAAKEIATGGDGKENSKLILDAANHAVVPGRIVPIEQALDLYRPALDPVRNCKEPAAKVLSQIKPQVESIINQ